MSTTAYDPRSLPPSNEEGRSRFELDTSPGGWPVAPAENTARCLFNLAASTDQDEPFGPAARTVMLKKLVQTIEGEPVLIGRGEVCREPNVRPQVPARIPKLHRGERAGALLDAFVLREPGGAFERAVDSQVWTALLEWAQEVRPTPEAARLTSDAVALAVLARQGIRLEVHELP